MVNQQDTGVTATPPLTPEVVDERPAISLWMRAIAKFQPSENAQDALEYAADVVDRGTYRLPNAKVVDGTAGLLKALEKIKLRATRHPDDDADDDRRNLSHCASIASRALAEAKS